MDISKLSDTELKALGFDQMNELQRIQSNLQAINIELNRRSESVKTKPKEKTDANN